MWVEDNQYIYILKDTYYLIVSKLELFDKLKSIIVSIKT